MERQNKPLLSVVIPTFNRPELLARCIQGLAAQTLTNFEAVVINDGSDPLSADSPTFVPLVARISPPNLTVINNARNMGSAYSRNAGITLSQGEIVAFTDDDAIPTPSWLEQIADYFSLHPKVTAVNGRIKAASLDSPSERIRQAYYDFRQATHSSGELDGYYKQKYGLDTDQENLANWLSLGNCAIQKRDLDPQKPVFDGSMRLNYGHKLARQLMQEGRLVTYDPNPSIEHFHGRTSEDILRTRLANGRNFCLLDDDEGKPLFQRFNELERYLKHVLANPALQDADRLFELYYAGAFIYSYICQKTASMLGSAYNASTQRRDNRNIHQGT